MTNTTNPFGALWDEIKAEAAKVETEAVALAEQFATSAVADIEAVFAIGAPLAIQAVMDAAPLVMGGSEKFGTAVTSVMQTLETKLGPVAIQDVQALIQTAYRGIQQLVNG